MSKTIFLLKTDEGNVIEVYDNRDLVKKLMPSIEAKLLVNITEIEELPLNPSIDLTGNLNFRKKYTVAEFLDRA
jgi:hypothetical protein